VIAAVRAGLPPDAVKVFLFGPCLGANVVAVKAPQLRHAPNASKPPVFEHQSIKANTLGHSSFLYDL